MTAARCWPNVPAGCTTWSIHSSSPMPISQAAPSQLSEYPKGIHKGNEHDSRQGLGAGKPYEGKAVDDPVEEGYQLVKGLTALIQSIPPSG